MGVKPGNDGTVGVNNISNRGSRNKILIILAIILAVVVIASVTVAMYIDRVSKQYDDKILPGVSIEGIDIGGLTKEEAKEKITGKYNEELEGRNINVTVGEKVFSLSYTELGVEYNISDTVDEAFNYKRDLSKFKRYNYIKNVEPKELGLQFTYKEDAINSFVDSIQNDVYVEKKDATIIKSGSNFVVTDEVVGKHIDVQALLDEVKSKVSETKEGNVDVSVAIQDDVPARTKSALSTIDAPIGSATTYFGTSDESRSTNIKVGAMAVNGTVLMPGETFSFNTVVGDTTPDKGYKEGGVYIGYKLEKGYGGGICQVSSTLHNAVLKTGILPDERTNHSMPVGYVKPGLDATIAYGYLDYVFTNSFDYPLYIEGYTNDGNVTFNIYSNSSINQGITYGFESEVYETIPISVKYEDNPDLPAGTEVVKQSGSQGYKARAYRIKYVNGVAVERKMINDDTYNEFPKLIERGTK